MVVIIVMTLDHHQHRQGLEGIVVIEDIEIVVVIVDIHLHQVHALPTQVHRLIVLVHRPVDHIEDDDANDHVCFTHFYFLHLCNYIWFRFVSFVVTFVH